MCHAFRQIAERGAQRREMRFLDNICEVGNGMNGEEGRRAKDGNEEVR